MQNWDAHDTKRLEVLKGWFSDSLPHAPIKRISYLRLDGDLYASTMDALTALYDKVSIGGFVYVDDYGSFNGCREAIYEFRTKRGIVDPLFTQYFPEGSQKNEVNDMLSFLNAKAYY
ncbi:hypothetical protein BC832DRAFT_550878 [Gaertneriomyces semiglobifer]|nr:hypothetical protein BC832DRAFT_550878 [Gaertneriomyces semiglobifer]